MTLAKFLLIFLVSALFFEYLKLTHYGYLSGGTFESVHVLEKIYFSYFIPQISLGTILPAVLLFSIQFFKLRTGFVHAVSSALVLFGAFMMQWNTMIGGQLFSKSERGFLSYHVSTLEGLTVILFLIIPFLILLILIRVFPLKDDQNLDIGTSQN